MEDSKTASANETRTAPSGPGGEPRGGREGQGQRRNRFVRTPRVCPFCKAKVKGIDFKQADQLRRYVTERGKIKARRKIGTCARHQRMLAIAIKRARHVALLPFTTQHVRGE